MLIAEMLLLVAVNDKGHVSPWSGASFLNVGLTGALLAELAVGGQLTIAGDGTVRAGPGPPDPMTKEADGPRQVRLRARLRETTGAGNGLPQTRRIPIEMPQGAEQGGQAAGLRGRHSNQPSSVLGL